MFVQKITFVTLVAAECRMNNSIYKTDSPFPIQFFYSSNCGSCKDALKFLQSYERKNPSTRIEYRNLVYNGENRQLFTEYKNQFRHSEIPYPAMFIGNKGITGSSDIIHTADQLVKGYVDQYLMRDQLFPVFS